MTLRLVKTNDGSGGAPSKCEKCGKSDFAKAGIAWNCVHCGTYVPTKLVKNRAIAALQDNLKSLQSLHNRLRSMQQELEELVRG